MEFLYVFSAIFISTFGLAMLLYFLWCGFSCRRKGSAIVVVPVFEQQSDIECLVKLLRSSGIGKVVLMDYGATPEQQRLCGRLAESFWNVTYCCAVDNSVGGRKRGFWEDFS